LSHLLCVDGIISLPWLSKELKNNLSKNNWLRDVILILLVRKSIFVGWGVPFLIVLVPRYKLSLCHTLIKPDLLGFSGIDVFTCGLFDHVITRFASIPNTTTIGYIIYIKRWSSTKVIPCEVVKESEIIIHEIS
jgi:hypothetical protein